MGDSRQLAVLHSLGDNPVDYVLLPVMVVFTTVAVSGFLPHTLHWMPDCLLASLWPLAR
jgi:hypothetical protein